MDLLCLFTLLVTAVTIASPLLLGGWKTYMDNPIHLAELADMSRIDFNGWSDIGNCGLPLGSLHSPLWFGLIAFFHRQFDIPLEFLYPAMLLCAFLMPSIVVYFWARRRLGPVLSCVSAYLVLIQYPVAVGFASVFGGMWTFYIAASFLMLLSFQLSASERNGIRFLKIVSIVGVISLSHAFFWMLLFWIALIHGGRCLVVRDLRRHLFWDAPAFALGFLSAVAYWLPVILTREWLVFAPVNLSAKKIVKLFLLPTEPIGTPSILTAALSPQTIPMLLLAGLGIAGTIVILRSSRERRDGLFTPVLLGWFILGSLTFLIPGTDVTWFGSQSWRLLYLTRLAFSLAGIVALGKLSELFTTRSMKYTAVICLCLAALGMLWRKPAAHVAAEVPEQMRDESERLWRWLRVNRTNDWGRVLIQDTFGSVEIASPLYWSHLLTQTGNKSGIRQVGPYYQGLPYPTNSWTRTEFGQFLGVNLDDDESVSLFKKRMSEADATHLVLCTNWAESKLKNDSSFTFLHREGRYSVYRFRRGISDAKASADIVVRQVVRDAPGHIRIDVDSISGGVVYLAESYHPFWEVRGAVDAALSMSAAGLMRLRIPGGRRSLRLEYSPPRYPAALSWVVWALIAISVAVLKFRTALPRRNH